MTAPRITFYFDFSSPYGYLAAQRIDAVATAKGTSVLWRPFLLGAVFKITGATPLLGQPMKGDYATRDLERSARRLGVPFQLPEPFPFAGVAASRAFYWLEAQDPALAIAYAKQAYAAIFGAGRDLSTAASVAAHSAEAGADADAMAAGLADPAVKDRLRAEVDAAIDRGVCGSPFFLVDGEPFWGADRLGDVADWLDHGW